MSLADLIHLLRQDLRQNLRFFSPSGRRTKKPNMIRQLLHYSFPFLISGVILYAIVAITPLVGWGIVSTIISDSLGIGSTLFNAVLLFTFAGSVMISTTTVANSQRMEYMMTMPIALRTLFLEKTVVIILYNSMFWLVVGVPIFLGFSIVSYMSATPNVLAGLSVIAFVLLMIALIAMGVALGGLVGLFFARILAGRRRIKQAGYFIMTAAAIIASMVWYWSVYSGSGGSQVFDWLINLAVSLGFSSDLTPGYVVSAISLGLLVGVPFRVQDLVLAVVFFSMGLLLLHANSVVSETAHYSGWLATGSVRGSKKTTRVSHVDWNPQPFPILKMNETVSVSAWYNLVNIRREARVFANYLLGPLRIVIWFFIPVLGVGGSGLLSGFLPFIAMSAMVPVATSYGLYFAGYETVYEGKNLMNLQLAATNLEDYVKGKVYSALPFSFAAGVLMAIVVVIISPTIWPYVPTLPFIAAFTTMLSGAISAYAAATGGDFKAERMVTRQRGASIQMPIRGFSILRAQLMPNMIGLIAVSGIISVGFVGGPLLTYAALGFYYLLCRSITRSYARSAGRVLARKESSDYM